MSLVRRTFSDGDASLVGAPAAGLLQRRADHREHARLPEGHLALPVPGPEPVGGAAHIQGAATVHAELVLAERAEDELALVRGDEQIIARHRGGTRASTAVDAHAQR